MFEIFDQNHKVTSMETTACEPFIHFFKHAWKVLWGYIAFTIRYLLWILPFFYDWLQVK